MNIAIFILVTCQTSAAAQGCVSAMSTLATEAEAAAPCHQTADSHSDTSRQRDCQPRCQSRDASFETAKIHLPAIDNLPLAAVFGMLPAPITACAAPNDPIAERAAPPPLILVYCRLLI
ncbi:MAG: hypothetical protein ABL891_08180 [Burkholderiales bacterium]